MITVISIITVLIKCAENVQKVLIHLKPYQMCIQIKDDIKL